MKKSLPIERINALAELDRLGYTYIPKGDDEIGICCPVHEDKEPSASLNVEKNLWRCHAAGCNAKGDIVHLLCHIVKKDRTTILTDLANRYDIAEIKAISPKLVEDYHENIWAGGPLVKALRDRGITDEMIRYARLGIHDGRITIPVHDRERRVMNIRKYLPGAPGPEKMLNTKGYSKPRLYQVEQLTNPRVWVCGGEMKALVVGGMLAAKYSIGAVAVTAGEGAWDPEFSKEFKGKEVFICMDVDAGGRAASAKIASLLFPVALKVQIIRLPLDRTQFPKGDINDYVGKCGAKPEDLLRLMEKAETYTPDLQVTEDEVTVVETSLSAAAKADNIGKTVCLTSIVQAMDETPYIVPKVVKVGCSKDQPNCPYCPVNPIDPEENTGRVELRIKGTSVGILSMVNAPESKQRDAIMAALRMPSCKTATFAIAEHVNTYDVRLAPQLTIGGDNNEHISQAAFVVGSNVDLNVPYKFTGRVHPSPKNQQAVLIVDKVEAAKDSLSDFKCTEEDYASMQIFQSKDIERRLTDIYEDFEVNVTRIYRRRDLHFLTDLTYHSPLYFMFDGQMQKGWVNSVVVGDSSQGKSETTTRLMAHYGVGERVDCKNASVAGLLGGLSQLGNRWMVSWGIIPTHDRRLVVLEEVKGAAFEVLSKLTDMRSSGIAEIPKIEKRRAHARTRLMFISNPRSNKPVSAYTFGCETIPELIGGLEDVRRFDVGLVMSSGQINSAEISELTKNRPSRQHVFTHELCRKVVLWSWTRRPEQVKFDRAAELACYEHSRLLCEKFTDALPLIDKGTTHLKLARLSAALAARLFNHEPGDCNTLLVQKHHVDYIAKWLQRIYNDPVFGYSEYTKALEFTTKVSDPDTIKKHILDVKFPEDLVNHLLYSDQITVGDLADWCETDRDEAQKLLSLFVRKHALYRVKRWYVKSTEFISLLNQMKRSPIVHKTNPDEEM
jgi:hypothetical protein